MARKRLHGGRGEIEEVAEREDVGVEVVSAASRVAMSAQGARGAGGEGEEGGAGGGERVPSRDEAAQRDQASGRSGERGGLPGAVRLAVSAGEEAAGFMRASLRAGRGAG